MTSRYLRMTDDGYKNVAPSRRAEEIDSDVVDRMSCKRCGSQMRYEPWAKPGSYVAYAVCMICQSVEEF